jgi:glycosyltransferase involved in cell wall biosynthesis
MPRILLLAESLPFPTLKGGDLRVWQNVNALASCARIGVFGLCSNDRRRETAPDLALAFWTASADPALAIPPPKGVRLPARAWLLDPGGHPSDLYFSDAAAREVERLLQSFVPDVVLAEGLWLHRYLDLARAAGCMTILDAFNVEALVFRELAPVSSGPDLPERVRREILPQRTEAIEREAVGQVDQLWVCSAEDESRMREMYRPRAPITVIPNGIRVDDYRSDPAANGRHPPGSPLTVVFPGFFAHPPNGVAAEFLVEEIFPRLVRECEASRLLLVGGMPPPRLHAAATRDERIVVTGAVRDVRPYLSRATVMAVPVFQGGGTRLKILEGFASGLPVVSTAKGAEGLGARDGTHLVLAESADEFVAAIVAVARDPELADRLAGNARALVAERFSWESIGGRIRDAVARLGIET